MKSEAYLPVTRQIWLCVLAAALVASSLACAQSSGRPAPAPSVAAATEPATRALTIEHLTPRRDSSGGVPSRFEWTRVEGADRYAIGLWNEVDVLIWRQDNLPAPFAVFPAELPLELGTYLWSVTALRDGRPLAESGLAAFVVQR